VVVLILVVALIEMELIGSRLQTGGDTTRELVHVGVPATTLTAIGAEGSHGNPQRQASLTLRTARAEQSMAETTPAAV
jgi:hypothetical protein